MNARLLDLARQVRGGFARVVGIFPGSSARFGPPRQAATTLSITDPTVLVRHSLIAARTEERPAVLLADPPLDTLMNAPRRTDIKEIVVSEIPRGRYWGQYHGYVIDRCDTLLTDLSLTYTPPGARHEGLGHVVLPRLRELGGTAAVINTLYGTNFHHWLLDLVPRFEWIRRAGFPLGEIDHFIFPKKMKPFHLETMERLGLDPAKAICSSPQLHVRADRLLVPAHSEAGDEPGEYSYTPDGIAFTRHLFLDHSPFLGRETPRRIVVSRERTQARRLVQGERTHAMLAGLGFTKIFLEDYSVREQAALFHQAECIVMPTGGGLANTAFCQPGTAVIELFSPSYYPPFTYALAGPLGLRYYALVADKISRPFPEARQGNEDIDFDPGRLEEIVRRAL